MDDKKAPTEIAWFGGESEEMNAAIAAAQASFSQFVEIVKRNPPELDMALVKYAFEATKGGAVAEHIFLGDVHEDDGALWGEVNGTPEYTDAIVEGDVVKIDPSRISDWLYVLDGKGTGGFTFKLMWKGFSKEDRASYIEQAPFLWIADDLE